MMNKYETILIELVKSALASEKYTPTGEMNSEELSGIYKESIAQTVSLLAYSALPENAKSAVPQFETAAFSIAVNNIKITNEHIAIGKALEKQNILYCILKGYASAAYYPDPKLRAMGDTDFLVAPSDIERATAAIEEIGYKADKNAELHDFHYEFIKGNRIAEMHYSISSKTEFGFDPSVLTDDILKSARVCATPYGEIRIPSAYHHAIIMLLHVYRHYVKNGIGLRHLVDWAVFVNSADYDSVATELSEFTESWHLTNFCRMLSQVSCEYLGITKKESFGCFDAKLSSEFMNDILNAGNFGRKKESSLQHLFNSETLDRKGKNYISTFFSSIKERVCFYWPRAEHNIFILVAGTVVFTVRYLFRAIIGKGAKIHLIRDYRNAKKQAALHQKLSDAEQNKGL